MKLPANKTTVNTAYIDNEVKIGDKTYLTSEILDENGHIRETIWNIILIELRKVSIYFYPDIQPYIDHYLEFKSLYPSFSDWFNEDIGIRVGNSNGSDAEIINFNARLYVLSRMMLGLKMDYPYIIAMLPSRFFIHLCKVFNIDLPIQEILSTQQKKIKNEYKAKDQNRALLIFALHGLLMYTRKTYQELNEIDLMNFYKACRSYMQSDVCKSYPIPRLYQSSLLRFEEVMVADKILKKKVMSLVEKTLIPDALERKIAEIKHPKIQNVVDQYYQLRKSNKEKGTISRDIYAITPFTTWLYKQHPQIDTLMSLTKKIMDEYLKHIRKGNKLKSRGLINVVSSLSTFFMIIEDEQYSDIPLEKVISTRDLPSPPKTQPRFIPNNELQQIMPIVRSCPDPYFKNMVIILRWEGLRIDELLRLEKDALYNDANNEPCLRVPASKTNNERVIPVHKEAETALKDLLNLWNNANNDAPITDRKTGKPTFYLLMKDNKQFTAKYVNDGLKAVCSTLGLLTPDKKAKHTSHAFRHTIATEMLNFGASMGTIMDFLGHESFQMVRVYAKMFNITVRIEYNKTIAIMEEREHEAGIFVPLGPSKINMNTNNLCETVLPVGKCYHSPQEKMCEFAYHCYGCRRIKHTQDDLPTLEQQYLMELHLATLAQEKGWDKEVDRHTKVAGLIKQYVELLTVGGENNAQS